MLFKRRSTAGFRERLRVGFWPRVSWARSAKYYVKRTLRLSASPYAIAIGIAVGGGISMTPFIGFHFLITFAITWLLRGNLIAGAIGTAVGNPLSFPFIWAITYNAGTFLAGGSGSESPGEISPDIFEKSWEQLWPLVKPMMIGSVPIGIVVGTSLYAIVYGAVSAYQKARRTKIRARIEDAKPTTPKKPNKPANLTDSAA